MTGSWAGAGVLALAILSGGWAVPAPAQITSQATVFSEGAGDAGDCAPDRVDLRSAGRHISFSVELADTPAKRARGLMYRDKMAKSHGMLFIYPDMGHAQFWMKNTYISLDLLFLSPEGRVLKIHSNAEPLSEAIIDGGQGVKFVLEINAGLADKLGLRKGDVLRHPAIGPDAAWSCK